MGSWCQGAEIRQLGYDLLQIRGQQSSRGGTADLGEMPGQYLGNSKRTGGTYIGSCVCGCAKKNAPSPG